MTNDDSIEIPEEWPRARPWFVRYLVDRRTEIETRLDSLEKSDITILNELGAIHEAVTKLHTVHADISEKYGALVNFQGVQIAEQRKRWEDYDEEQRAQGELLRRGYDVVCREDRNRSRWRIATLISVWALFIFMLIRWKV